ncbi:toll/interleukin-1 receptor domain-containing protein [Akkermansia massiliensis]
MKTPVNIFISYSHVDTKYCEEFKKHMIGLERSGLAKPWTDHKISPGEKLDEKISDSIRNTDIMLLLVSVDFLNSDYCMSHEFKKALEKQNKEGKPIIIPIITRACDWKGIDEIKVLKALPTDGQSISSFRDPDQAYVEIVNSLRKIIESGTLDSVSFSKEAKNPDDEEVKLYLTKNSRS